MKVYNWVESQKEPEKPTIHDMRYGIGCMNDLTIVTADLFKELLVMIDESRPEAADSVEMLEKLQKDTLGRLWGKFRSYYSGELVKHGKVMDAIEERNYFIHGYHNIKPTKKDGKRLFDTIHLLMKVNNQLTAVQNKINKDMKCRRNVNDDALRKSIINVVRSCNEFQPGRVYLSELGNRLNQQGCEYDRKLSDIIAEFGWKSYCKEDFETLLFVVKKEIV